MIIIFTRPKSSTKSAPSGEDISKGEDTDVHQEAISSPKGEDSEPSEDIFRNKMGLFKCYHDGCKCNHNCDFQTDNEEEYRNHGAQNHLKNPLLYPSKAEIEQYGTQGKS